MQYFFYIFVLCLSETLLTLAGANFYVQHPQELRRLYRSARGVDNGVDMICPPCEQVHCSPRKSKLKCKGGIAKGICNCCPRCAKLEGEACRGKWNYLGDCDAGLECVLDGDSTPIQESFTPSENRRGVCTRMERQAVQPISDEGQAPSPKCEPKCSAEFCTANPKSICSAVENADEKQLCQGECQHTSCMACQFVEAQPDCGRCGPNDFRCMRQFAKCIKRNLCLKKRYPCGRHSLEEVIGKFQCRVPYCKPS